MSFIGGQVLPYFLTLQDAPGSFGIVPDTVLEPAISPRNPASFPWRTILETKVWALGMFISTAVPILLGNTEMTTGQYVCALIHVYTYIYKYVYME